MVTGIDWWTLAAAVYIVLGLITAAYWWMILDGTLDGWIARQPEAARAEAQAMLTDLRFSFGVLRERHPLIAAVAVLIGVVLLVAGWWVLWLVMAGLFRRVR